jgi:glycosyltransferase involved in cell wall biosynthesis
MGKLRIALCITDLDIGGAEQCLAELALRLDRGRFEPAVYSLAPRPAVAEASCIPALEAAGVEFHCLGAVRYRQIHAAVKELRRLLERQQPHLVQTFLFHANIVGRIAAHRAGVRRVVCGIRVAERQRRWHLWVDRLTARLVDRYVCVSQSVAEFSQTQGGLPVEKLAVIPNGIDGRRYPAQTPADLMLWGIAPGRRAVTYVGRLDAQKGVRWLLEASSFWLDRLPDCDLLLVGHGPEESALRRVCGQLGIASRVHFAGWQRDVGEILAASGILVLSSRWEGMPNVILQAMASRLPVLATDVEGVRELLGEEADAQTVPYGDSQALADKMVEILSDRVKAGALGHRNRERAEAQFGVERMVDAYQELWESLVMGP